MGAVATFLGVIIFLLVTFLCQDPVLAGSLQSSTKGTAEAVGEVVVSSTEQSWFCCSLAALWVLGLARDASLPGSHQ